MSPVPSAPPAARVSLVGIPIDPVSMDQAVTRILRLLESHRQHHVITPNSEMLVEAARNREFRRVLQGGSLNIPDSAGLLLLARLTRQRIPHRVTGTDCMQELCRVLTQEHPVFLLGARPGVAERVATALRERNPRLKIAGVYSGSPREVDAPDIIARINASNPAVLFVAYGAPAQELWINRYLHSLTSVRVAMGVGGAFDFVAGVQKRAPEFFRRSGLEWVWRLIRQPSRIVRIWNAVAVFPFLVLRFGRESPPA